MAVLLLPANALHQQQQLCGRSSDGTKTPGNMTPAMVSVSLRDFRPADGSKTPGHPAMMSSRPAEGPKTPGNMTPAMDSVSLRDFRPADGSKTPGHPAMMSSRPAEGPKTPGNMTPATMSSNMKDFWAADGAKTPAYVTPTKVSHKIVDYRVSDGSRTPASMTPAQFWNTATPCRSPSSSCSLLFRGRPGPRRQTISHSSPLPADPFQLQDSTPASGDPSTEGNNPQFIAKSASRAKGTFPCKSGLSVAVVAPGGGTAINSSVYSALDRENGFSVKILGQSRAPYDRYPAAWGSDGAPAPNLETFALDLAAQNAFEQVDCLIVGSRGGQVVLPSLWKAQVDVPPTIVMNGGCAMSSLPISVSWPDSAVTFLLIGGNDYFRGHLPLSEYLQDTQRRVPCVNKSTAILLVNEMGHMPQANLLTSILSTMISALTSWKSSGDAPMDDFKKLITTLRQGKWSGVLSLKTTPGDKWDSESFP